MDKKVPSRRQFLTASGAALSAALAGCSSGETGEGTSGTTDTTTDSGGSTTTESSESSGGSSSGSFSVKVVYDGEWQGSVSAGGSMKSIQGTGEKTVELSGEPSVISANAQKKDGGGSATLTVQILKDGKVVKESSTSAEYGMAQATYSAFDSGGDSGGSSSSISVEVVYDGEWQGSVSADGSARSIQGTGSKTIDVEGSPSVVSANAQKKASNGKKLTIKILEDGEVLKKSSTTAEYGMAQVTATL